MKAETQTNLHVTVAAKAAATHEQDPIRRTSRSNLKGFGNCNKQVCVWVGGRSELKHHAHGQLAWHDLLEK